MLSKAQEAALLNIRAAEKELHDHIKRHTRSVFPKRGDNLLHDVIIQLDRIREQYIAFELETSRFRRTVETIYDMLLKKKRFSEAANLAKKYNL